MLDKEILKQIGTLEKNRCHVCEDRIGVTNTKLFHLCQECPVGKEIKALGERLQVRNENSILSKGPDMTFKEVLGLLDNGVPQKTIYNALEMKQAQFKKYMNNHGYRANGMLLRSEEHA